MSVEEFQSLGHGVVFQCGIFFMDGHQYRYCFQKSLDNWSGYYLVAYYLQDYEELSKYGSPMTLEMAEKLVNNKDLLKFYR